MSKRAKLYWAFTAGAGCCVLWGLSLTSSKEEVGTPIRGVDSDVQLRNTQTSRTNSSTTRFSTSSQPESVRSPASVSTDIPPVLVAKDVDYGTLALGRSAPAIYSFALKSKDPRHVTTARHVAKSCMPLPASAAEEIAAGLRYGSQSAQLVERFISDFSKLQNFCGDPKAERLGDAMEALAKRQRDGSISPSWGDLMLTSTPEAPARTDVELAMLSNPSQDPFAFHIWLSVQMWRSVGKQVGFFLPHQKYAAEDELYRRFVPSDSVESFRRVQRCALTQWCPPESQLSQAQSAVVIAWCDKVEILIRQQRWQELFAGVPA
jgi:hypothetical protein